MIKKITLDLSKTITKLFDVIITTNSKEIISIAKSKKIKNVENRPFGLSSIYSSSALTVIHAIKWYELNHSKIDAICLLQPTSPFRDLNFVNNCIDIFIKNSAKADLDINKKIIIIIDFMIFIYCFNRIFQ